MDNFLELLFSVFFDGTDKLFTNQNIPNGFKYIFLFLIFLFLLGSIILGILVISNSLFLGIFFLTVGVLLFLLTVIRILQWRKIVKKKKLSKQENVKR